MQFVMAAGLAMVMVVGLMQLIAYQYARGAVMTALERGVRAGTVVGAGSAECEAALADSLAGVLGGAVGESLSAVCEEAGGVVSARAEGTLPGWTALSPAIDFDLEARATREPGP